MYMVLAKLTSLIFELTNNLHKSVDDRFFKRFIYV